MPKLKMSETEKSDKEIAAKIRYAMDCQGITTRQLALSARITRDTLLRRLREPDNFRLSELRQISKKLRIPLTELLGGTNNAPVATVTFNLSPSEVADIVSVMKN